MKTKTETKLGVKGLGSIPNPPDPRRIRLAQFQKPVALPRKYKTDISMLPVRDQRALGSCVGQTHAEIVQFFEYKETGKIVPVSARHIYARCKALDGYNGEGTYPAIAAKVITSEGAATTKTVPDDSRLSHDEYINVPVTQAVKEDAYPRRVKPGYAVVDLNLEAIKQAIYQNGVIAGALQVGNWSKEPLKPEPDSGGHDITFFGFEDVKDDTKIFFRNHWSDDWMDEGDGEILWSEYQGYLYDFMAFTDIPNELLEDAKKKPFVFTRQIKYGSRGLEVLELQKWMIARGRLKEKDGTIYTEGTGYFGRDTERAVQTLQREYKIVMGGTPASTGYGALGPKTRALVNSLSTAAAAAVPLLANVKKEIIISAGHYDKDPGASGQGHVERDETEKIRNEVVPLLEAAGFKVHVIKDSRSLAQSIADANKIAPNINDALAVEIHLNSLSDARARGTEAFYGTTDISKTIAATISAATAKALGIPDRGAKPDTQTAVGELGWIRKTNMWASLIEVCFISNAADMAALTAPGGYKTAAQGIVNGICELFGVKPGDPGADKLTEAKAHIKKGLDLLGEI